MTVLSSVNSVASFIQEASPEDPLTFDKAAELLRKAATIENFVFVPDAQDPNLDVAFAAGCRTYERVNCGIAFEGVEQVRRIHVAEALSYRRQAPRA